MAIRTPPSISDDDDHSVDPGYLERDLILWNLACRATRITSNSHKAAFLRSVFPRVLRPRFALFPIVGTGRIDVTRGLVSAFVVSRVMAVNRSHVKGGRWPASVSASVLPSAAERSAKPRDVRTARLFGIPPTTIHKYEPLATRGFQARRRPSEQGFTSKINS
ncbi:hypothetical protein AVEN_213550-1 [Araneus ventricosus]|uniref:Uncharacterized protein n=1 Tax=Araneus ventricosus TaxID=182803 RepID=A0A4Y2HJ48_ARAVE|nr:hypothetical protein AVEN_213550-1 [Araneus ventricosus]